MHLLALIVCILLMAAIRTLGSYTGIHEQQPTLALAMGFMLLAAFIAGRISRRLHLPRVTGYLLVGVLIGPHVFRLITESMTADLLFVNGLTVSLIALTAGGEIKLEWLRGRLKEILSIAIVGAAIVFLLVFALAFLLRSWLPFPTGGRIGSDLTVAVVLGVFAIANSPMVVMALIAETESRSVLAQTVLGVTILRDVMVIVLFSVVLSAAKVFLGGESVSVVQFGLMMTNEIGGSIAVGLLLGLGLAVSGKYVAREMPIIVVLLCFFMAHLGTAFHMDPLLMGLAAGFFVENIARKSGEELIHGIEKCSLPLYCLFFGLAGVLLDLSAFAELWPIAVAYAAVRCLGLLGGTYLAVRISGCDPVVGRLGWMGFIANAGVLLAMASIVAKIFPEWGESIQTLVIAIIGINLLIGPIGFRYALLHGEPLCAEESKG